MVALSPGSSDIIGFRPRSPIATGSYLDRAEKIPNIAQTDGTVDICVPRSGISGPLRGELPHVQIFMTPNCSHEMPSFSAIILAEIRLSS